MVSTVTRRASLVVLAAMSFVLVDAVPSSAGPPSISPAQAACVVKTLGAKVGGQLVAGTRAPTAAENQQMRACLTAGAPTKLPTTGAWITASPFDLTKVTALSRFRSCAGHDYSGVNSAGRRERNRSMKHYVLTSSMWQPAGTVKGYAPFDGTVTAIDTETLPLGRQIRVRSTAASPWEFVFFHADPLVKVGAAVKAGQPVAAWPPANAASMLGQLRPSLSFDVALKALSSKGESFESMMLHMSPAVLAKYAAKGLTPVNLVVPEKVRDAAPCTGWDADPDADYAPAST